MNFSYLRIDSSTIDGSCCFVHSFRCHFCLVYSLFSLHGSIQKSWSTENLRLWKCKLAILVSINSVVQRCFYEFLSLWVTNTYPGSICAFFCFYSHSDSNLENGTVKEDDKTVLLEGGLSKSPSTKFRINSTKANLIRWFGIIVDVWFMITNVECWELTSQCREL